jgi:hypothetical protein
MKKTDDVQDNAQERSIVSSHCCDAHVSYDYGTHGVLEARHRIQVISQASRKRRFISLMIILFIRNAIRE